MWVEGFAEKRPLRENDNGPFCDPPKGDTPS